MWSPHSVLDPLTVLEYEPNNHTVQEFLPVIMERLKLGNVCVSYETIHSIVAYSSIQYNCVDCVLTILMFNVMYMCGIVVMRSIPVLTSPIISIYQMLNSPVTSLVKAAAVNQILPRAVTRIALKMKPLMKLL